MDSLLKFITCGSVDDGKSTLIGHMLYDAKLIYADQKRALELDSKVGSRGGEIDYSLLLDGLMAEREQGITIDVAYRYFTTEKRSFIVADTPGHEEYTRNMAVGASFADLAVILIDASQGVLTQTRRHTRICSLMGIRHFVFTVNKMDLMKYDSKVYKRIETSVKVLLAEFDYDSLTVIPVSATEGDNITKKSPNMPWYQGKTLLECLEEVNVETSEENQGFLLPVQRVCRPHASFRGFQGQVGSGKVETGDLVSILPSHEKAVVREILAGDRTVDTAVKGQPVTICLDRELDVSRGCVIVKDMQPYVSDMFTATILWMDDTELVVGKNYLLKLGTALQPATVMNIKYKIDVNTGDHIAVDRILKNELVSCDIQTASKVVFDAFSKNKVLGELILMDRMTNMTSACGVIEHPIRRADNLIWQQNDVTREFRAQHMGQKPLTLWLTGLSGAGKSALANELEKRLVTKGRYTMLLDGDNIRMGLNRNLGFKHQDRIENIRRVAEVSKLMNDAGLIVLTAFISPYARDRQNAREIIGDSFKEIYVSTSLEECERRDVKGLYKKARSGELPNFTGLSSPYEIPEHAEIVVDSGSMVLEEAVDYVMKELETYL